MQLFDELSLHLVELLEAIQRCKVVQDAIHEFCLGRALFELLDDPESEVAEIVGLCEEVLLLLDAEALDARDVLHELVEHYFL